MEVGWPVSVKGVLFDGDRVLLLKNDRGDWELPGGRVDPEDSSIEAALAREIAEETGLVAEVGSVRHVEIFEQVGDGCGVIIVAYDATVDATRIEISHEHVGASWVPLGELDDVVLPDVYHRAIAASP